MNNQSYFMSYSRHQFYFVESLVLRLQSAGLNIWFDVQELGPGESWREQIQEGLDNCKGLILVASRTALESEFVRLEWEAVLKSNKPIYVVIFEACELPAEITGRAVAIIDMRWRFAYGVKHLVSAIDEQKIIKDNIPTPNRFRIPTRFPLSVVALIFYLLWSAFLIFQATFSILMNSSNWQYNFGFSVVSGFMLVVFIIRQAWNLSQRRISLRQLLLAIAISNILYLIINGTFTGSFFAMFALSLAVFFPGTYRWLPTGEVPHFIRRLSGRIALPSVSNLVNLRSTPSPKVSSYYIHNADADEKIANRLNRFLSKEGHNSVSEIEANQQIVLISERITTKRVEQLVIDYTDTLLPVLVSNVDAGERIKQAGDFQFVDYRQQRKDQIKAVSSMLTAPQETKFAYGMSVLPRRTSDLVLPGWVSFFGISMWLFVIIYLFIAAAYTSIWIETSGEFSFNSWRPGPLAILFNITVKIDIINRVYTRRITLRWLWVYMISIAVISFPYSRIIVDFLLNGLSILPLFPLIMASSSLYQWLPKTLPKSTQSDNLPISTKPGVLRILLQDMVIYGGVVLLIVVSMFFIDLS